MLSSSSSFEGCLADLLKHFSMAYVRIRYTKHLRLIHKLSLYLLDLAGHSPSFEASFSLALYPFCFGLSYYDLLRNYHWPFTTRHFYIGGDGLVEGTNYTDPHYRAIHHGFRSSFSYFITDIIILGAQGWARSLCLGDYRYQDMGDGIFIFGTNEWSISQLYIYVVCKDDIEWLPTRYGHHYLHVLYSLDGYTPHLFQLQYQLTYKACSTCSVRSETYMNFVKHRWLPIQVQSPRHASLIVIPDIPCLIYSLTARMLVKIRSVPTWTLC